MLLPSIPHRHVSFEGNISEICAMLNKIFSHLKCKKKTIRVSPCERNILFTAPEVKIKSFCSVANGVIADTLIPIIFLVQRQVHASLTGSYSVNMAWVQGQMGEQHCPKVTSLAARANLVLTSNLQAWLWEESHCRTVYIYINIYIWLEKDIFK